MSTALSTVPPMPDAATLQEVLLGGNIATLRPGEKVAYYNKVCESLGLNPLTKPFEFLTLNGKTVFYALKSCTEQLRQIHGVSVAILAREVIEGCYVVTARATDRAGRSDESIGAVPIEGLKGEVRSNALMKAETKAKRRVTLSICGLGILDESEVESIPASTKGQRQDRIAPGPDATLEADLKASVDAGTVDVIDAKTGEVVAKPRVTKAQLAAIHILKKEGHWSDAGWKQELQASYGTDSSANLTKDQASHWIEKVQRKNGRLNDDQHMKDFVNEVCSAPPAEEDPGFVEFVTFASDEQKTEIATELRRLKWNRASTVQFLEQTYKVTSIGALAVGQATDFLGYLMRL